MAKELLWRCVRFRPAKKPICLYASRRTGSTLLMQAISVNRGVMFSDQPFGLYNASSANINRLPVFPYSQIASPDADEAGILHSYIDGLLSGEIRSNCPWKFWSRDFHFFNDRVCLKITDAKAMVDWIDQHYDVHTVVLTRHPIAQAISVSNNQWLTSGKGFLKNARFVEQWLTDDQEALSWDLHRHGTDVERRVVDWVLENLVPLVLLRDRPNWLYISYEDLMVHTAAVVDYLSEKLQLADRQAMTTRIAQPSRSVLPSSGAKSRQMINQRDQDRLVDGWQAKISDDERRACFRILDQFGIDVYQPDSSLPDHRRVGRTGFA